MLVHTSLCRGWGEGGSGAATCVTIKVPTYSHHLYLVRSKAFLFGIILGQLHIMLHTQLCHDDTAEILVSICPHNVQLSSHRAHKHDLKLVHTCADWSVQFLIEHNTHACTQKHTILCTITQRPDTTKKGNRLDVHTKPRILWGQKY